MEPAFAALEPQFEQAFWRTRRKARFRSQPGFSRKKGHFEPDRPSSAAGRWAVELLKEESQQEIATLYEAAVVLGNRRSRMARDEWNLECAQFRYAIRASQDEDPTQILVERCLWILQPLNELPAPFDSAFPVAPEEIVVPFRGGADRQAVLETLEDWEERKGGKIFERQLLVGLRLRSGLVMELNLEAAEAVFTKAGVSGPLALAAALAADFKQLGKARGPA